MRSRLDNNILDDVLVRKWKLTSSRQVLSGDVTLDIEGPVVSLFESGGANRTITFSDYAKDIVLFVGHVGATDVITVNDSNGGLLQTLEAGEGAWFFCSGDDWIGIKGGAAIQGLQNIVEDLTPELGGDLAGNGFDISDVTLVDPIFSGSITGTYTFGGTPTFPANVVLTSGAQTLTDKTLTSPVINTPTGIVKGDVGLGNVDNTSDADKPVSTAQQTALDLKANLESPTFTGTPAAPTAAPGTNTTQLATTGFVKAAIDVVLGGVSAAFDTLSEIATELGLKAPLSSPTFTGTPAAPTAAADTNTTQIATTAYVQTELGGTTLTAGAGLTGGGTLAADRSFAVGAGTGITVNADDVAIATAYQAVGKQTIAIPAGAWKAKASGGATAATYQDIAVFSFNGTTATRIRTVIPMPKGWDEDTITFKVFGVVDTGGASGDVAVFKMAARAYSHDNAAWTTADLSALVQSSNMSWTADDDILISAESSALTVNGGPAEGDLVMFEFWRDPADGSDNNTADFLVFAVHIYYTTNAANDA